MSSTPRYPSSETQSNVSLLIDRHVEAGLGERPAYLASGTVLTYEELRRQVNRMGNLLHGLGVRREQRVLLALDDSSAFPIAFFGAMRIGAVPVPVSPLDTAENLRHFVEDSYAELVVCEVGVVQSLSDALGRRGICCLTRGAGGGEAIELAGAMELTGALEAQEEELAVLDTHPEDMAFWLYSSGSSGLPKGVVHQHRNVAAICESFAREVLHIEADDRIFATSKLHHAYALGNSLFFSLYFGAASILLEGAPKPEQLLQTSRELRPTVLFSVPALYDLLAGDLDADGAFDSVRLCVSASAPLAENTFDRWQRRFGLEIVEGIGSTEMLSTYCSNRPGEAVRGVTGRAVPGYELRLTDEHGEVLEGPAVGTLEVRGGSRAARYWHQPEKEKHSMRGEWFVSGDRFERRPDGNYVYVGRDDDMLKVGGLWVSPLDVEEVLREHPVVADAGVVGVSIDSHTRIVALVQSLPETSLDCGAAGSAEESDRLGEELREWCRQRMRHYECPHVVRFVQDLPRTLTGKPQRFKLREQVERELDLGADPLPAEESRSRLAGEPPTYEHARAALDLVCAATASVLGHIAADRLDPQRSFKSLGFDSVAAVELRNRLSVATGLQLPSTLVFDHPTPTAVARHLRRRAEGLEPAAWEPARLRSRGEDAIAIVGMSCRYPGGVRSPEGLWDLLAAGVDSISPFPTGRGWDIERLYNPDPDASGTSYARAGGFLYDADEFDAGFFDISPREAMTIDPQQRLLLEGAWEALEDAGVDPTSLRGTDTGVYAGVMYQDYGVALSLDSNSQEAAGYALLGSSGSVASGRIAYALGLEGPAVTVDTACSSSLVALHLACQSLRTGECSFALAGGVTVMATPGAFVEYSRQRGLARDGRCKAFSDDADGTSFSEGMGLLALRRLADAEREGDRVLAVVRGSAVNQDGASNGLTAPHGPSQERVIRQALANAGVSAGDVDAVEAHGTGTALGDPIEAQALLASYGREHDRQRPLWLGSLKSNIGHAQAAAGVAGVIKMVKAFEHGALPKTLHAEQPTRHVDWSSGSVSLLTGEVPWLAGGAPRRAGVSSFGVSGTNAHVILEESPLQRDARNGTEAAGSVRALQKIGEQVASSGGPLGVARMVPWVISGRGPDGLRGQARRLAGYLEESGVGRAWSGGRAEAAGEVSVGDVGISLTARAALEDRAVVVGDSDGLLAGVGALADDSLGVGVVENVAAGSESVGTVVRGAVSAVADGGVVFVFPGQGSQWVGMAVGLLDESPVFASCVAECERVLSGFVDWSVVGVLRGEGGAPGLDRVDVVQPVLFCVMVGLAGLWRACGVEPVGVVGHSQGEIAAAYVAGGLSLGDAVRVVALRSRALRRLAGLGGMASVALGVEQVSGRMEGFDGLSIAAVNGPSAVVLSGDVGALEGLVAGCEADGVRARLIPVDYAAHSSQVELIRGELLEACEGIVPCSGHVPFYSAVTGGVLDTALLDGDYWYRNLRETVQFEAATRAVLRDGYRAFVETSPHPVLTVGVQETADSALLDQSADAGERHADGEDGAPVVVVGSLRRECEDLRELLSGLAEVWVNGVSVAWSGLFAGTDSQRVSLPTYAFQRERFWLSPSGSREPARTGLDSTPEQTSKRTANTGGQDGATLTERLAGLTKVEQVALVSEIVLGEVASVLGHASAESVDPKRAFRQLGFDSLKGVELRNRLRALTALRLPATLVFDHPTVDAVVGFILNAATGVRASVGVVAPQAALDEPIAIVGMSCRYPGGVGSPEDLWELLARGGDAISSFPEERGWDLQRLYDPDPEHTGTSYTREGGFLERVGDFDAAFFGISPREALAMDPQQRLLLEASWEALEDAGVDPASLRGSATGVYVGISGCDYGSGPLGAATDGVAGYRLTGGSGSVASGRVSYSLGLEGPAVSVDTACSSSLVAMHLACAALRSGECSRALAGGVTVMASPDAYIEFSAQRGLARDGRCKSFAAGADGIGWSEGVGVIVLQPLSEARRQGQRILAVIRGSAINQDGASNGLTAPNGPSQQRVIAQALANARLAPAEVDAVEAHGTGTTLGDPIEAQALLSVYGHDRGEGPPLWLGSVKSNIGHSAAAAGVAGVIKMVKALEHGRLPRTLYVEEPSGEVDWSAGAVSLLTEEVPWQQNGRLRRAGVSSFGVSGTNAHVILEEAPQALADDVGIAAVAASDRVGDAAPVLGDGDVVPWVLSGRGVGGLRDQAGRLAGFLDGERSVAGGDVGVSLASRPAFEDRAVVVGDLARLQAGLAGLVEGGGIPGAIEGVAGVDGGVVFVFPGQGSQWVGMAVGLLDESPVFASCVAECERVLSGFVDWSVVGVLRGEGGAPGLDRVDVVQPVLFCVMVGLAGLWRACGVEPVGVVGHSQGEIAAAYVAGGLSLGDAVRVVALRSRALRRLAGLGGMASVALGVEQVSGRMEGFDGLSIAAVNGPSAVVLSGDVGALEGLVAGCEADGVRARLIPVDYAAHSSQVELIRGELLEACEGIVPCSGHVPFYSAVTGGVLDTALLDGDYWYRNLRETVQFEAATRAVLRDGYRAFVEASPHPVLTVGVEEGADRFFGPEDLDGGAGKERLLGEAGGARGNAQSDVLVVGSLRREEGGLRRFLASVGEAWVRGVDVDWRGVFAGSGAKRVSLPTYAFQRERFWLTSTGPAAGDPLSAGQASSDHPFLGAVIALADGDGWLFTGRLSLQTHPWLADHAVMGTILLPGTAFLELALHAAGCVGYDVVKELVLETPLILGENDAVQLQINIGPSEQTDQLQQRSISIHTRPEPEGDDDPEQAWTRHAGGRLTVSDTSMPGAADAEQAATLTGETWPPPGVEALDVEGFYEELEGMGIEYGPAFRGLRRAWRDGQEVFAEVALPGEHADTARLFGLHPALLDAALHAAGLAIPDGPGIALGEALASAGADSDRRGEVRLPFSWDGVSLRATGASSLRVRLSPIGNGGISLTVANEIGQLVLSVQSLLSRPIDPERLHPAGDARLDSLFEVSWTPLAVGDDPQNGVGDEWVMLGPAQSQLARDLSLAEVRVTAYEDLAELGDAIERGELAPRTVLLDASALLGERSDASGYTSVALGAVSTESPAARTQATVCAALEALQAWLSDERLAGIRLVVLSRGAVAAGSGESVNDLAGSGVWGLVRSAQTEHPERFALIDLDEQGTGATSLDPLLRAALLDGEPQLAIRDGRLLVPRLRGPSPDALVVPSEVEAWCLESRGGGTLEDISLVACDSASRPLGVSELRIGVRASGLNFRDVLAALGMSVGEVAIGGEGAGVVLEVGPGVEGVAVGDRVMGLLVERVGPISVTDYRFVVRVPDDWSFARAASVPMAFLTAYYGLVDLGGLRRGEKVLVHAAAGGVGMAAVQIARHLGAEVLATASEGKWGALAALGLDEARIASSRTLEFEERFATQTEGGSVDVVLNSLTGEFADASLRLLAPGGRFLELGKTDIRDSADVAAAHRGVTYSAFSLEQAGPERIHEMLEELSSLFEQGSLEPLPMRVWDIRDAPDAFRFMSQARHVGKIVLSVPTPSLLGGGAVLVTGGTGTVGGVVARHLVVEHGVGCLVLASRRGLGAPGALELKGELEGLGARVEVVACDVSDREGVRGLVGSVPEGFVLRGVVHAAGALDDGVISSLSGESVGRVFGGKAHAAWYLHELTEHLDLSMFVMFSSAAGSLGSPGQGNYAAANAFLDSLASYRRARGLAASSIAWGYWEQESELTSGLGEIELARMARQGILPITNTDGVRLFDLAYRSRVGALVAMRLDAQAIRTHARAGVLPLLMSSLVRVPAAARRVAGGGSLARRLAGMSAPESLGVVLELVRREVAIVLGHSSPGAVDPERAFKDLGFDSLASVELRNRLNNSTGLRLPATLVFDYPNTTLLTHHLIQQATGTTDARVESGENEIRRALASIPLARLRDAGLLDSLLTLAGMDIAPPATDVRNMTDMIDEMDIESLVQTALGEAGVQ